MIRVRFATGLVLQYNDGDNVVRNTLQCQQVVDVKGLWIAQVPNDCVIECVLPCRVYREGHDRTAELVEQVSSLADTLRKARRANSVLRKRLTQAAPTKRVKR